MALPGRGFRKENRGTKQPSPRTRPGQRVEGPNEKDFEGIQNQPKNIKMTDELGTVDYKSRYHLTPQQQKRSDADIRADQAAERSVESPSYRAEQNARALSNPNLRDGIYGPNDPTTAADNNISKDAQSRIGGKTGGLY